MQLFRGAPHRLANNTDEEYAEVEEHDHPYFPYYWDRPGIGASTRVAGNRMVSYTLNCYINVDDVSFILITCHVIRDSLKVGDPGLLGKTIVSPALSEVDEMKAQFEHSIEDREQQVGIFSERQYGNDDIEASDFQSASEIIEHLLLLYLIFTACLNFGLLMIGIRIKST